LIGPKPNPNVDLELTLIVRSITLIQVFDWTKAQSKRWSRANFDCTFSKIYRSFGVCRPNRSTCGVCFYFLWPHPPDMISVLKSRRANIYPTPAFITPCWGLFQHLFMRIGPSLHAPSKLRVRSLPIYINLTSCVFIYAATR
jgi:hypothetical protein